MIKKLLYWEEYDMLCKQAIITKYEPKEGYTYNQSVDYFNGRKVEYEDFVHNKEEILRAYKLQNLLKKINGAVNFDLLKSNKSKKKVFNKFLKYFTKGKGTRTDLGTFTPLHPLEIHWLNTGFKINYLGNCNTYSPWREYKKGNRRMVRYAVIHAWTDLDESKSKPIYNVFRELNSLDKEEYYSLCTPEEYLYSNQLPVIKENYIYPVYLEHRKLELEKIEKRKNISFEELEKILTND